MALQRSDDEHKSPSTVAKGPHPVVVRGLPSALALHAYGRGEVASYELEGSDTAIQRLSRARFGL